MKPTARAFFLFVFIFLFSIISTTSQPKTERNTRELKEKVFTFWLGTKSKMTIQELASYCAPVFWFSSDEPELLNKKGKDIKIPSAFPFDSVSNTPVVYYQFTNILVRENAKGKAFKRDYMDFTNSTVDLTKVSGFEIDYNHYYEYEVGLGSHRHDTEQSQFKIYVMQIPAKDGKPMMFRLVLLQVTAKAHALSWYDNIYKLDTNAIETKLPFHILVEEGKHASCTDVNGDGYYTPGYDVNIRTHDAWGLRDVIRTGELFTAEFEGYMAKVRKPEYQVLPPLPPDSPHRYKYVKDSIYAPDNAVYVLRPMPSPDKAMPDRLLRHDMEGYYTKNWPVIERNTSGRRFLDWWDTDNFIKSIAVAARYNVHWGISVSFPLLIFKNVETPIIGGWTVNRIYAQGRNLSTFGYGILLTGSASRFMDPYFAAGFELNKEVDETTQENSVKTDFVLETGLKFRANVKFSPFKFLSFLTDFWGVRIGIKNTGIPSIHSLDYVFEIGAGVW